MQDEPSLVPTEDTAASATAVPRDKKGSCDNKLTYRLFFLH